MVMVATTRVCKICGIEKPIEDFPKIHEYRGRSCKKCYYELHKDRIAEYGKKHYTQNRESEIEKAKLRYLKNRIEILLRLRRDNLSPERREILVNREKRYYAKWRNSNIEIYGTACTPEFTTKVREHQRQKRAINKLETGYVYSKELRQKRLEHYRAIRWQALEYYGGKCECCGEAGYDMLTFDHKEKTYYKNKARGVALTYDVIKVYKELGYPNRQYRILCWNCNTARGFYGYCPHAKQKDSLSNRSWESKLEMIDAYGGKCVLCDERLPEFLTIDHINGGGNKHRQEVGNGHRFRLWLKRQNWPRDEYRLLCANCNCSDKQNKWTDGVEKEVPNG